MMTITLLGTSALIPLPDRAETAVVLKCGERSILFDCGEGTQTAARKAEIALTKLDMIALTHYHGDHIFGLPGLLQTLTMLGRTEPLLITGPEGLEEALAPILKLVGWTSYEIRPVPMPEDGLDMAVFGDRSAGMRLTCFPTQHRIPSQGYCFTLPRAGRFMPQRAIENGVPKPLWGRLQKGETVEVDGRTFTPDMVMGEPRPGLKFVFTGDTAVCDTLREAAEGADLLISEATYAERSQDELAIDHGHTSFAQAAQLAADAHVKRLWLAHYSQMVEDPESYLDMVREIFPQTTCGRDGMSIELRFEKD